MIIIENGCKHINGAFVYEYEDSAGVHTVTFSASQIPKIGDSIDTVADVLVPLVGYRINNDPGVVQKVHEDEQEWPSRIRAQ